MVETNDQRKLQALLTQVQSYQAALQDIVRQVALAERALEDMAATIEAIEELPKSKESEAMVPIGAGVFAKANLLDKKNVVIAVGAGVYIKKTHVEAKAYLMDKKAKLEEMLKSMKGQAERMGKELEVTSKAAEELYVKLQGQ